MTQAEQPLPGTAEIPRLPAVSGPELGRRLRDLLKVRHLTTYGLSQVSCLSERHLEDLVAGKVKKPRPKTIVELAGALDVPIEALLGETPGRLTLVVEFPESLADTLYALSAVQRSSVEQIAERVVAEYLATKAQEPAIAGVVAAINAARDG